MDNWKYQYSHPNRKSLYPRKYGRYHQNSNDKPKVFDHGELEESVLGDSNNDRRPLICLYLWKNYDRRRWNSNGKSKIYDYRELKECVTKTGNTCTSGIITDGVEILTANRKWQYICFGPSSLSQSLGYTVTLSSSYSWSKMPSLLLEFRHYICHSSTVLRFWRPYRYFRLSVAVAITCQHFFVNSKFVVRISMVSEIASEI